MALLEKYLVVKTSSIPGAGKGLFTQRPIPKGTRIIEYKGKITTWKEADHQGGMNAYIYYVNKFHVIDSASGKNLARYCNDAKGATQMPSLTNNCKYVQDDDLRVYVESKKDLAAHEEILVGYGKKYWDVINENRKQLKKTAKKAFKKRKQKRTTKVGNKSLAK